VFHAHRGVLQFSPVWRAWRDRGGFAGVVGGVGGAAGGCRGWLARPVDGFGAGCRGWWVTSGVFWLGQLIW
jgi:hypothetical protein